MDFTITNFRYVRVIERTRVRIAPNAVVAGSFLPNVAVLPTQTVSLISQSALRQSEQLIEPLQVLRNNILLQRHTVVFQRAFEALPKLHVARQQPIQSPPEGGGFKPKT